MQPVRASQRGTTLITDARDQPFTSRAETLIRTRWPLVAERSVHEWAVDFAMHFIARFPTVASTMYRRTLSPRGLEACRQITVTPWDAARAWTSIGALGTAPAKK